MVRSTSNQLGRKPSVKSRAFLATMRSLAGDWPLKDTRIFCGHLWKLGVDNSSEWQDYSIRETSADQLRIEDAIEAELIGRGGAALHIGIGNSGLARRLGGFFSTIDGITIGGGEFAAGRALALRNYAVFQLNKYAPGLAKGLPGRKYDVIIDNNPTSFGCCRYHLFLMMAGYSDLLNAGGCLLSDEAGLSWTPSTNKPAWGVTRAEWCFIAARFGLNSRPSAGLVITLEKPCPGAINEQRN